MAVDRDKFVIHCRKMTDSALPCPKLQLPRVVKNSRDGGKARHPGLLVLMLCDGDVAAVVEDGS